MNFHIKALLVGAITIFLCIGVVLWTFVIDKGTFELTGDQGYSVEITGSRLKIPKKVTCNSDPCEISLPSGYYNVDLTKNGYFDKTMQVTVPRRKTTQATIEFEYIPTVSSAAELNYDEFFVEEAAPNFKFEIDAEYNKQRLTLDDEVLAYFDRELINPEAFGSQTGKYVLVADQGEMATLYLIDTEESERSYLGELTKITTVKWSLDDSKLLVAEGDVLWIVDTAEADFEEWAFDFSLEKAVWGEGDKLYFATNKNLAALVEKDPQGTVEVLKNLLNGEYSEGDEVKFSIGLYDVESGEYLLLYEVGSGVEIGDYSSVKLKYDVETNKLYFSDGEVVYEVVREIR